MTRSVFLTTSVTVATLLCAALLLACGGSGGDAAGSDPEAALAAMMKYAATGEHHRHLTRLTGEWGAAISFWTGPGAAPQVSRAKAITTPILGNRFVVRSLFGELMGQKYEGMRFRGYDTRSEKYVDMWIDSLGTAVFSSEGECTQNGEIVNMSGSYRDPLSGRMVKSRSVTMVINDDRYIFQRFDEDSSGKEYKKMEITFMRERTGIQ